MSLLLEDFDIDAILAPIPGDKPAGADPRDDVSPTSAYFRLRDARAEARDMERQAEAPREDDSTAGDSAPPAPWRLVRSLSETALREIAKDLEVATWLTEALVRAAGLRGLATGAAVITGLVERYWDDLYPTPDEDGMETRVGPLAGLSGQSAGVDGTLMQPLRKIVFFVRPDTSPFAYWQYTQSWDLSGISDSVKRQQRIDAGVLVFEDLEKEARRAGAAHWSALQAELAGAIEAWAAMTAVLETHAGPACPSTSNVRDLLVKMEAAASRFAPDVPPAAPSSDPHAGVAAPASAPVAGLAPQPGAPMGREDALRQLAAIAAWFRQHEPNSPLAYTLDEAVRRGRMSWPDLVAELMPDETTRNALLVSLGIKPPPENAG